MYFMNYAALTVNKLQNYKGKADFCMIYLDRVRLKKNSLACETDQVKIFLSLARLHSRKCIRKYIYFLYFLFQKDTH